MKIALVCFNLSWQAGGVRLIYEQAHALKRMAHTVVLYAPEFDEKVYPELWRGLDIRHIKPVHPIEWQYKSADLIGRIFEKMRQRRNIAGIAKQIAGLMDEDFQVVNVHDFAYKLAPFYKRRNPRAKIVWYMADPPYIYLPKANAFYDVLSRVFNWYADISEKRKYFHAIDAAAVLVRRNQAWLAARGVFAKIVWTGINFDQFYAAPRSLAGRKSFTLMSVGALNKYRRFEDVIEAVDMLRKQNMDVRLVIVCKNIWGQDEYANELRELVAEKKLQGSIRLLFEGATEEELKKLYATSDFFAVTIHLPPPRNGFGWQMVVFEAIAAGLPTVVCNTNDVSEALKDGETALFVDPASPAQIASKIKMLIDDPALYARIAEGGQKFVRDEMSWEKFAQEILDTVR
ncbi:MAG: glycosyltransferase family 4 protein [bacterium]|nr:glycosyltransferase family 4 protein [bacterium]